MRVLSLISLFAAALLVGCSSTGVNEKTYKMLSDLEVQAPIASDIHGTNGYVEPKKHTLRASATIHTMNTQREGLSDITNPTKYCDDRSVTCQDLMQHRDDEVNAQYKITYPFLDLTAQWLFKPVDAFMIGAGITYNDGPSAFFTMGFNTKHLEAGASASLWVYHRHYEYKAYTIALAYDEDGEKTAAHYPFHEEFDDYSPIFTFGGYASIYYGPVFFTYSVSAYKPTFEDDDLNSDDEEDDDIVYKLPIVLTNYYTIGYRLDKNWEANIGVANVFGSFANWHWSGHAGISFYML